MNAPGGLVSSTTLPFGVNVVSWGPGSQWIAAGGGADGSGATSERLAVIDAASGGIRWSLATELPVSDITVSPDGRWLAVSQGLVRVLSTDTGAERCRAPADHQANMVVFSPDSSCVAATIRANDMDNPEPAWVMDAATGAIRWELPGHTIMGLAFSPDSRWVAAADSNGPVVVFDAATGAERPWPDNVGAQWVVAVAFSPDGQSIAAGFGDNTARLFEADTGRQAWVTTSGSASSVAFSADGQWVAATGGVFRVADGSLRFAQPAQVPGDTVTFSPTLRHIAISNANWAQGSPPQPGLTVLDAAKGSIIWQATVSQRNSPASGRPSAATSALPATGFNAFETPLQRKTKLRQKRASRSP